MQTRFPPAFRAAMVALLPTLLFLSFDLQRVLIVMLVAIGLAIAAFPLIAPKASPIWRYSIWSLAALLGLGVILTNPAGGAQSNQPRAPQIVKQDSAAVGTVYWGNNNTIEQFSPTTGKQTPAVTLAPGSEISDIALSPDGASFALVYASSAAGQEGGIQLALLPRKGGTPRVLLSHAAAGGDMGHASWSVDGKYIFVTVTPPKSTISSITRVSVDGGAALKVADEASEPSCPPDGQTLIYVHTVPNAGYAQLWRSDLDGANARSLSDIHYIDIVSPVVSPDGKTLAFSAPYIPPVQGNANPSLPLFGLAHASAHGGNWEVWTMPLSGGTALVRTAIAEFRPRIAWSPAGDQLGVNADLGLYVINLNQNKDSLFDIYTGTGLIWAR
jgi:Tol biopolymer transport system component